MQKQKHYIFIHFLTILALKNKTKSTNESSNEMRPYKKFFLVLRQVYRRTGLLQLKHSLSIIYLKTNIMNFEEKQSFQAFRKVW